MHKVPVRPVTSPPTLRVAVPVTSFLIWSKTGRFVLVERRGLGGDSGTFAGGLSGGFSGGLKKK